MSDADGTAPLSMPTLIGVGLGPGDPELITPRARRAIEAADVVFAPVRRTGEPSYALQVADALIDRRCQEVVALPFPTDAAGDTWHDRCANLLTQLGDRRGVFLTEGDPALFSTFGHVASILRQIAPSLRIEAVPGVSSVTAAAAAAGISLADDAECIAILPAMHAIATMEQALLTFDCVVLIKVAPVLEQVIRTLDRLDRLQDAVYVRRCGRPEQEVIHDLRTLAADPPRDYFALVIVRRRTA